MLQPQRPVHEELEVERSGHGGAALFDSFSESCGGSKEGSRRGAPALVSGQGVLSASLQQLLKPSSAPWRDRHAGAFSLHSGTEFYKSRQRQVRPTGAADSTAVGDDWQGAPLEGSVSRHRGAQFYAQAAARWKAVAASGSQILAAELEGE